MALCWNLLEMSSSRLWEQTLQSLDANYCHMKSKETYYDVLAVRKHIFLQMEALHMDFYTVQFIICMTDLLL